MNVHPKGADSAVPKTVRQSPARPAAHWLALTVVLASTTIPGVAQEEPPAESETALLKSTGVADASQVRTIEIIRSTHERFLLRKDIARYAVGDQDVIGVVLVSNRELLALGKTTGRTRLILWFADGTTETFLFVVKQDLSLLDETLKGVHPAIQVEIAPDRDAIVLRGVVPDVSYSRAAEDVANAYLSARRGSRGRRDETPLVREVGLEVAADPVAQQVGDGESGSADVRVASDRPRSRVINMIRLETLPPLLEEKIKDAIEPVGGANVKIRRVVRGDLISDEQDTFILEGTVPEQVALVRVLSVAARLVTGRATLDVEEGIQVVANEGGGVFRGQGGVDANQNNLNLGGGGGGGSRTGVGGGNNIGRGLRNSVRTNVGRAKAISVAGGRILSFLEVKDLPQVRVNVKLYEVDRAKLQAWSPDWNILYSNFDQPALTQTSGQSADVQNLTSFLQNGLTNNVQLVSGEFTLDAVFNLLETEGIARTLSTPSLSVLSGEIAAFLVGGQIPVLRTFAPTTGAVNPGVFNSVEFKAFGVQLSIRPLVGDDGSVTLDVIPQISEPDPKLTAIVGEATGTSQATASFRTRAMKTSARLNDGQTLLIAGLMSRQDTDDSQHISMLAWIPVVGLLFQRWNKEDEDRELVILVNPTIVREPSAELGLWSFPTVDDLLFELRDDLDRKRVRRDKRQEREKAREE